MLDEIVGEQCISGLVGTSLMTEYGDDLAHNLLRLPLRDAGVTLLDGIGESSSGAGDDAGNDRGELHGG